MSFSRGAVWFVELPDVGDKPALIISAEPVNLALDAAIVARITSQRRRRALPTTVRLAAGEAGLPREGVVVCHDLFTLPRRVFRRHAGLVSPSRLLEIERALGRALGLPDA